MRRLAGIAIVVLLAIAGTLALLIVYSQPQIGAVVETREAENANFRIRIENRAEECSRWPGCLHGAYYVFLSSPRGVERWREIMTIRHDDPGPIPRDNIRFVSDRIAYVFMDWTYAVTTNGGIDWSVWNAETDLPQSDCCNFLLIKTVHIAVDGKGTMTFTPIAHQRGQVPMVVTTDFGRHWYASTASTSEQD